MYSILITKAQLGCINLVTYKQCTYVINTIGNLIYCQHHYSIAYSG